MGKKTNAGRFERGYLKVTTENLSSWTLSRREKPPNTNFKRCPYIFVEVLRPVFTRARNIRTAWTAMKTGRASIEIRSPA